MAIELNDGLQVNAPRAADMRSGKLVAGKTVPFASTAEALAAINVAYRYEGLEFLVNDGTLKKYRFTADYATDGVEEMGGVSLPIGTVGEQNVIQYENSTELLQVSNAANSASLWDGTAGAYIEVSPNLVKLNNGLAILTSENQGGDGVLKGVSSNSLIDKQTTIELRYNAFGAYPLNDTFNFDLSYLDGISGEYGRIVLTAHNWDFSIQSQILITGEENNESITIDSDNIKLPSIVSKNYADDAAAATGGVPVGGIYHTSGTLKIRLT